MRLLSAFVLAFASLAAHAACGPQNAVPEAERVANTVKWATASEQDNFGYDVYRGAAEDGPFAKLTKTPILGHGTTDETNEYSYRDAGIDPCLAYWYYVESIATDGARERFTPVFKAPPKQLPPAAE